MSNIYGAKRPANLPNRRAWLKSLRSMATSREAADAGRTSKLWHEKDYPRIQIVTIEGLLNGTERVNAPPQINPFAIAAREEVDHKQTEML